MRKEKDADTIKITKDVRIPGTDVILEAGDRIRVLKEEIYVDVDSVEASGTVDEKGLTITYYGDDRYELSLLKKNENDPIVDEVLDALEDEGVDQRDFDFARGKPTLDGIFFRRK